MRKFFRHAPTGLYVDRPLWTLSGEDLEGVVALARIASSRPQNDEVDLEAEWPKISMAFLNGPVQQVGETLDAALQRISNEIANELTDPEVMGALGYLYGPSGKGPGKRFATLDDMNRLSGLAVSVTPSDSDGDGRYTLEINSDAKGSLSDGKVTFKRPDHTQFVGFMRTLESDAGQSVRPILTEQDIAISLEPGELGRITTDFALRKEQVSGFGLDVRYTEMKQGLGNTIANNSRLLPLIAAEDNTLPVRASILPISPFEGDGSYLEIASQIPIRSGFGDRAGKDLWVKANGSGGRLPRFRLTHSTKLGDAIGNPSRDWEYFALDGEFDPVDDRTGNLGLSAGGPREIVVGMSEREYFELSSGDRLVFHANGPAMLPSDTSAGGLNTGEGPQIGDALKTSWVSVKRGGSHDTRLVSEGVEVAMFGPALEQNLALAETDAVVLDHDPIKLTRKNSGNGVSGADQVGAVPVLPLLGWPSDRDGGEREDTALLERDVIRRARRERFAPQTTQSLSLEEADNRTRTTPLGLQLRRPNDKWELLLAKSEPADGVDDDSSYEVVLEKLSEDLLNVLLRDRLFLVANNFNKSGTLHGALKGKLDVGGWALEARIRGDNPNLKVQEGTYVLIKDENRTIEELLKDRSSWAGGDLFLDHSMDAAAAAITQYFERANDARKDVSGAQKGAYEQFLSLFKEWPAEDGAKKIKANPDWRGILIIKPSIDLGSLPDDLTALSAAFPKDLTAHHLGIEINRPKKAVGAGGNDVKIELSPVFGMIRFPEEGQEIVPNKSFIATDGNGQQIPAEVDDLTAEDDFAIALERLHVTFRNGSITDFGASLLLRPGFLFGAETESISSDAGPPPPTAKDPVTKETKQFIRLEGSYESRMVNGKRREVYTFENRQPWILTFSEGEGGLARIFREIRLTRASYASIRTTTDAAGNSRTSKSRFGLDGSITFVDDFPTGFPLKLGKAEFLDLGIELAFGLRKVNDVWEFIKEKFAIKFAPRGLRFDILGGLGEGFLGKLPFKFKRFEWWDGPGISLPDIGYFGFGLAGGESLTDKFKFGLHFDLDLGSLGSLGAALKDFKLGFLLGWGEDGGKTTFSFGLKFEGSGGDGLDIGIGNILKITADRYDVSKKEVTVNGAQQEMYFIYALNAKLIILGKKIPDGPSLNIYMFLNPEDIGKLGWFGVLTGFDSGKLLDVDVVALGQRVDPFVEQDGERLPVKALVDKVKALGASASASGAVDKLKAKDGDPQGIVELLESNAILFKPESEWALGVKARFVDLFDLGFVMRDPDLYGIRLDLNPKGKTFFSIDIAYRKLSDELGVYSTEIVLPPYIRQIELGAASLTIGVIGLEIFTDGGFTIDLGFPKNRDFSRAFTVQVLPFIGSGGIYFRRVKGLASRLVPVPRAQGFEYNPVTEIGLGFRIGLGKEFQKGPLRAGLSLTVYGYLIGAHGVLRKEVTAPDPGPGLTPRGTYIVLKGAAGILGEVYGYVDFGIVKAGVSIRAYIEAGVIFETDRATILYMEAGVSVRVVVVIGRIKIFGKKIEIKITFSWATKLRFNWELGSTRGNYDQVYNRANVIAALAAGQALEQDMYETPLDWSAAPPHPEEWLGPAPIDLKLVFAPDVCLARDVGTDGNGNDIPVLSPEAVVLLAAPVRAPNPGASAAQAPTALEKFIKGLAVWAYAAHIGHASAGAGNGLADFLTDTHEAKFLARRLVVISQRLAGSDENSAADELPDARDRTPGYADIVRFLEDNAKITIAELDDETGTNTPGEESPHSFFPVPRELEIVTAGFEAPASLKLEDTLEVTPAYEAQIEDTFQKLSVFAADRGNLDGGTLAAGDKPLVDAVFEEHIGLLMRSAIDHLVAIAQDLITEGNTELTLQQLLGRLVPEAAAGTDNPRQYAAETAAFAGRFFLHGLTLPTPADWNGGASTKVPEPIQALHDKFDDAAWPLFRLASLQVPLLRDSAFDENTAYKLGLRKNGSASWLDVENGEVSPDFDGNELAAVNAAALVLEAEPSPLVARVPEIVDSIPWESSAGSPLFLSSSESAAASHRLMWQLPSDVMAELPEARDKLELYVRRGTVEKGEKPLEPIRVDRKAIALELGLRQITTAASSPPQNGNGDSIPPSAAPVKDIYEIVGVEESSRRLLDGLVDSGLAGTLDTSGVKVRLYTLRPGPNGQPMAAAYAAVNSADEITIIQTNLSIEPHPPANLGGNLALSEEEELDPRVVNINDGFRFAELIRRAAIVNTGGYYLYSESKLLGSLFAPAEGEDVEGERRDPHVQVVIELPDLPAHSGAADDRLMPNALLADMDAAPGFGFDASTMTFTRDDRDDITVVRIREKLRLDALHKAETVPVHWRMPNPEVEFRRAVAVGDQVEAVAADFRNRFTLLDFEVSHDGTDLLEYHETLPLSPTDPVRPDETDEFAGDQLTDNLVYRLALPFHRLKSETNPYAVVGETFLIRSRLRDTYGNTLPASEMERSVDVKFVDLVQPLKDLPFFSIAWDVSDETTANPKVDLSLLMGAEALVRRPDGLEAGEEANWQTQQKQRIASAVEAYRMAKNQLTGPHTTYSVRSNLIAESDGAITQDPTRFAALSGFLDACIAKLEQILSQAIPADKPGTDANGDLIAEDMAELAARNALNVKAGLSFDLSPPRTGGAFEEIAVELRQLRDKAHVANVSADVADQAQQLFAAKTLIRPAYMVFETEDAPAADKDPAVMFGERLEKALDRHNLAIGAPRNAGSNDEVLWLVPSNLLEVAPSQAWRKQGPAFLSVPPLSTSLRSYDFDDIPVYPTPAGNEPPVKPVQVTDADLDEQGRILIDRLKTALRPATIAKIVKAQRTASDAKITERWVSTMTSMSDAIATLYARSVKFMFAEAADGQGGLPGSVELAEKIAGGQFAPLTERFRRDLSSIYGIETLLAAPLSGPFQVDDGSAPLVHGKVTAEEDTALGRSDAYSYVPSVVTLAKDNATFFMTFDAAARDPDGTYDKTLDYKLTHIQRLRWPQSWRELTDRNERERYRSTSWLRLVSPVTVPLTEDDTPQIKIPVARRDYPKPPQFEAISIAQPVVTEDMDLKEKLLEARRYDLNVPWTWEADDQDEATLKVTYNAGEQVPSGPELGSLSSTGLLADVSDRHLAAMVRFVAATDAVWPDMLALSNGALVDNNKIKETAAAFLATAERMLSDFAAAETGSLGFDLSARQIVTDAFKVKGTKNSDSSIDGTYQAAGNVAYKVERETGFARSTGTFEDVDILNNRTAWPEIGLTRNSQFEGGVVGGSAGKRDANKAFIYELTGIRTGRPFAPDQKIDFALDFTAPELGVRPLETHIREFLRRLLSQKLEPDQNGDIAPPVNDVRLDIEMAFVSGRYKDFDRPNAGLPGTLIGKLVDLEPDPAAASALLANRVIAWVNARGVERVGGGWSGTLRLRINLYDHTADGSRVGRNKPFLRVNQALLNLGFASE